MKAGQTEGSYPLITPWKRHWLILQGDQVLGSGCPRSGALREADGECSLSGMSHREAPTRERLLPVHLLSVGCVEKQPG